MNNEKGVLIDKTVLEELRKEKAIYKELLKIADKNNITVIDDDIEFEEIGAYETGEDKTILLNVNLNKDPKQKNRSLAFNLGISEIQENEGIDTVLVANREYENRLAIEGRSYAEKLIKDIEANITL